MLTKETIVDHIEVLEDGHLQVRRATYILEDGKRITRPDYERVAYEPGADIALEHARVRAIAAVVWTPDVIQRHRDRLAAQAR